MYKIVAWRYGSRVIEDDFETIEEAVSIAEYRLDEGLHFFECVIDENDIIVKANDYAGDSYQNEIGKKYIFD